ncbi:hypothetical protein P692DRAFT_20280531 [Suillus brevipes Sb2]|nr:hypothetical protein P692DRAFT_20280531 [Suillus brevipes Sb2]
MVTHLAINLSYILSHNQNDIITIGMSGVGWCLNTGRKKTCGVERERSMLSRSTDVVLAYSTMRSI